jgi:hypothetical protein
MKTLSILFIAFLLLKYISFGQDGWFDLASGAVEKINSIYFIDDNNGFIVCDCGKVLRTNYGGISFIEEKKSSELSADFYLIYSLSNPFNPTAKIKYFASQSSILIIKIFDVLGNEIETLVNEEKPTGTDKVSWNAEILSSVVYFYQFKAGSFVETKKIIFLESNMGRQLPS